MEWLLYGEGDSHLTSWLGEEETGVICSASIIAELCELPACPSGGLSAGGSCAAQHDVEIWQGGCVRLLSCPGKTEPEGEECEPSLWKVSV